MTLSISKICLFDFANGCEFSLSKAKANDSCSRLSTGAQHESNTPINVFPQRGEGGHTGAIDIDVLPMSGASEQFLGSLSMQVFEPRAATGSEHFARQDSGLSQIFKLIVSTSKKRLNNINLAV